MVYLLPSFGAIQIISMDVGPLMHDQLSLDHEPERNVDYLAHDWRHEEIRATKRYLDQRRTELPNFSRLDNALWRAWFRSRQRARYVPARYLGWDRDTDTTWLYGPFKPDVQRPLKSAYEPLQAIPRPDCFRNSPSGILRWQTSGQNEAVNKNRRRVRFNEEVQQCRYLESGNGAIITPLPPSSLNPVVGKHNPTSYTLNRDISFDSDIFYEISFDFDGTPC